MSAYLAFVMDSAQADSDIVAFHGCSNAATQAGLAHSRWSVEAEDGALEIAAELQHGYVFENALGYWEGDSGNSFPKDYLWTQCLFNGGSLMLSVANIPFGLFDFTGIIGVVYYNKKEYRFATYLGAYIRELRDGKVRIKQGNMEFEAGLLEKTGKALNAPVSGSMIRTVHESASCKAYYKFRIKGRTVFSFKTDRASFEYEYPN